MANKEPVIVIKKVIVKKNGHHGGSWKVAFADFMTAMMAFFLVMWLIGQSEEVKEGVSDYFSTPSVIEYNYANYGAQLTLEKLFLDLVNEPLKAFEQFVRPMDKVPNIMDMGMQKIQLQYLESKLGEFGVTMNVISDEINFAIPAEYLFQPGIPRPNDQFVPIMENIREIVMGLKDVDIFINSYHPMKSDQFSDEFNMLAEARLDLISQKIEASIERENVDIYGKTTVEPVEGSEDSQAMIQFRIKQKFSDVTKVKEKTDVPEAAPVENVYYDENYQQQYKEYYEKTMKDQIAPEAMPKIEDPSDGFGSFVDDVSSSGFPETE